ncbi:MAG: metallophosphoesterase family protein [Tannerella sp.]|jgi:hypothetical protein|nr:metallophosphoesterase family protein [Tannerella sp.]
MNRKTILFNVFVVVFAFSVAAQHPELKFHSDGSFKILQLTDLHIKALDTLSNRAIRNINRMLDYEKPDLVVITGDLIFAAPGEPGLRMILEPIISRKLPFAVTWGNHDNNDCDMTRREMQDYVERQPYNVGFRVDGLNAESVFKLPIKGSDGKTSFVLWVMDSGAYSRIQGVEGYDFISYEQIEWYNRESRALREANDGFPVPALAFYHIPVREFDDASRAEHPKWIGHKLEHVGCSLLNSGFFTATLLNGDVMGHFCGHEHDSDFVTLWHGIMLGYGRFSGGNTVYNNLDYNGGRVFLLKDGVREFDTYVRLSNGDIIERVHYPGLLQKVNN